MTGRRRFRGAGRVLAAALVVAAMPALAQTQSTTGQFSGLKLSGDQPIQIESDKLEVHQNESTAVFSGNVSVVQGDTLLKAGRMTVHYTKDDGEESSGEGASALPSGSSSIERLEVDGKVYIKSRDQVATGDHGSFDMKSQLLILSGDEVVLTQGENVVVGCKLTVHMESGEAQLDGCASEDSGGRVKMLLKPDSQEQETE